MKLELLGATSYALKHGFAKRHYLNNSNAKKWFKCQLEDKIISEEEYLKGLLIISGHKSIVFDENGRIVELTEWIL